MPRVLVADKRGRKQRREVSQETLDRKYQRVSRTKGESYYGPTSVVRDRTGRISHRYLSPKTKAARYQYVEGAWQKRRPTIEPEAGQVEVRLVVVYGAVFRGERPNREYAVLGEWYWYLRSDASDNDVIARVLDAAEQAKGRMYKISDERVAIGLQRFHAKAGPIVVDLDQLIEQFKERAKAAPWKKEKRTHHD